MIQHGRTLNNSGIWGLGGRIVKSKDIPVTGHGGP
jgi:hypothetical protein